MINDNNRIFKVKFNSSENSYSNLKFSKTKNYFKPKSEITPTKEDIYYDEVVYYDGGNVKGYGYEE